MTEPKSGDPLRVHEPRSARDAVLRPKTLIVGGGIGGMALAIALHQRGISAVIVEIDPDWTVYGAGITITGPTLRAFRDLGLLGEIEKYGAFVDGHKMFLFDGTLLAEQLLPPVAPGLPASGGIMRPILHRIMSDEVKRRSIEVRLGHCVDRIDQQAGGLTDGRVEVTFGDGSREPYDLVVGADGIYSTVRALCFPDAIAPKYSGQMIWRVVADRPTSMDTAAFFFGHERIGGIIPCSANDVYAFILHPSAEPARVPQEEYHVALREMMEPFGGTMAQIRDSIDPSASIVYRPFEYALQPAPWHRGAVVLIGDAAHATTPHLASGAGIAVEDALVLADEIARGPAVEDALRRYTERRFERCRFVVETSVAIGNMQLRRASPQEIGTKMGEAMHRLAEEV